jgi:hypothetical protein
VAGWPSHIIDISIDNQVGCLLVLSGHVGNNGACAQMELTDVPLSAVNKEQGLSNSRTAV